MAHNWVEKSVDEIAEVVGGSTPSTKEPDNFDGDVPWLTPKDLSGPHPRYLERGERNLSQKGLDSCSAHLLPKNTVLLSTRAPIGYLAIAANPISTNQGFRSLVVKPEFDHEFVYYWLYANVAELERHASGTTFKELSGSSLKQIKIKLPLDRKEQCAIARILGTLDDKIELNRKMNATLEATARALFQSWFVDFDPVHAKAAGRPPSGMDAPTADLFPSSFQESEPNEIPMGWTRASLGDFASFQNGYAFKSKDWQPEGIPVVKIGSVKPGVVDLSGSSFVSPETVSGLERFKLSAGDILVGMTGYPGEVGVVPIYKPEPYLNQRVGRIAPPSAKPFLYSWIHQNARQEAFKTFVESRAYGSAQANVSGGAIMEYPVVYPGDDIARAFEAVCRPLIDRILRNDSESAKLAAIRDSLLPKLLDGSLSDRFSALIND